MNPNRIGTAVSLLAAGLLLLSGCGAGAATHATSQTVNCGGKPTLTTSGATSQVKAMDHFVDAFEGACSGQTVEFTPKGDGTGIRDFIDGRTDFAGTSSPLDAEESAEAKARCGSPVLHLPMTFAPIGIVFNVKDVSSLRLNAPTAAKIFNGAIAAWNDPSIRALNPDITLPDEPIRVVFRSDDSGLTDILQQYLQVVSGDAWGKGLGRTFNGGVGVGVAGAEGVATSIATTEGAIGYSAWSVAQWWALKTAKLITSGGPKAVGISTVSASRTVSGAKVSGQGNDLVIDTVSFFNPSEPGFYPIVVPVYQIVCSKYPDAQTGTAVKAFLQSATGAGQNGLREEGYIRIPHTMKSRLLDAVNSVG